MANFFYKYIVKPNLFIAFCACCFYLTGLFLLDNTAELPSFYLLSIIFLSTFLTYTISQKPFSFKEFTSVKITKDRWILLVTFIAVLLISIHLTNDEIIVFIALGLVSFFYNAISLKHNILIPLRGIPLLKIFLIAFVWTGVGVILPALQCGTAYSYQFIFLVFAQFFFILAITLPFDIRDFYKDVRSNLITLPSVIGIKNTKWLAYLFLVLHALGILLYHIYLAIFYIPFLLLVFMLIKKSNASRPNYYYIFFVDGLIVIQFIVIDLFFWLLEGR